MTASFARTAYGFNFLSAAEKSAKTKSTWRTALSFDWSVNLGNVLTAVGLLLVFLAAHRQNITTITEIKTKVEMIYDWWKQELRGGRE